METDILYCEECGAKLLPGSRFCEECGTLVRPIIKGAEQISTPKVSKKGIILISTEHCSDKNEFLETLNDYVYFSATRRNVDFSILDVDDSNNIQHVFEVLEEVYREKSPDYLIIVGDEAVFPTVCWENYTSDGDEDIDSDLPYMTLSFDNPFEDGVGSLEECPAAGRILGRAEDNFADAVTYMINTMSAVNSGNNVKSFGLSALVWRNESNAIFHNISGKDVVCSPDFTLDNNTGFKCGGNDSSILYFNLHGSDETEYWYGQSGMSYPPAIQPSDFLHVNSPYCIGVEACYGAAYQGRDVEESSVRTALVNGCISLLGASRIAYGTSEEPGMGADIIVREYLKNLNNGFDAGTSYKDAVKKLLQSDVDDVTIKTVAEFALYGDPSVALVNNGASIFGDPLNRINVDMPNINSSVKLALTNVNSEIKKIVDNYAYSKYLQFSGAESKTFKLGGTGLFQSIYECRNSEFSEYLKVYYDEHGKIKKEYISK